MWWFISFIRCQNKLWVGYPHPDRITILNLNWPDRHNFFFLPALDPYLIRCSFGAKAAILLALYSIDFHRVMHNGIKVLLNSKLKSCFHAFSRCTTLGRQIIKIYHVPKGQLNSEWIYEVAFSPKMPTKIFPDFCPTKETRIVALFLVIFWWV